MFRLKPSFQIRKVLGLTFNSHKRLHTSLNELNIGYSQLESLPFDENDPPKVSRPTPNVINSIGHPDPIDNPFLVHISKDVCQNLLEIDYDNLQANSQDMEKFIQILSGNEKIKPDSK